MEKQGHQGHVTQHIGDLAHVEGWRWCGLVILLHIQLFYRTGIGQVQSFEGAVEFLRDSGWDVVFAIGVTGFRLPLFVVLKRQVTSTGSCKTEGYTPIQGHSEQCPAGMV